MSSSPNSPIVCSLPRVTIVGAGKVGSTLLRKTAQSRRWKDLIRRTQVNSVMF